MNSSSFPQHTFRFQRRLISLATAGFFLLAAAGGWVPQAAASLPRHVKPRPPYNAPYDVIEAVNAGKKTVVIGHRNSQDHTMMTLRITQATEIQVQGQQGTISGLRKGMRVDVTRGTDETEASRLVAN